MTAKTFDWEWEVDATAFTSPRGVRQNFAKSKPKTIRLAPGGVVLGISGYPLTPDYIYVGDRVAFVGVNQSSGKLLARLAIMTDAVELYQSIGARLTSPQIAHLLTTGDEARMSARFATAVGFYNRAIQGAEALKNSHGMSSAYSRLGFLYSSQQKFTDSLAAYTKAEELARSEGDVPGEAEAQLGRGRALEELHKPADAVAAMQTALQLSQSLPGKSQILFLSSLRFVYLDLHAPDAWQQEIATMRRSIPVIKKEGNLEELLTAELDLGMKLNEKTDKEEMRALSEAVKARLPEVNSAWQRGQFWIDLDTVDSRTDGKTHTIDDLQNALKEFEGAGVRDRIDHARELLAISQHAGKTGLRQQVREIP